jgi:DnaJ-class molecular chaperone
VRRAILPPQEAPMKKPVKKKEKCKNCEGKGLLKNGDKVVRCKRCNGTGFKP